MWCVGDRVLLGLVRGGLAKRGQTHCAQACPRLERGTHQRPAKSLFRYGFDSIRQAVLNAADEGQVLEQVLSLLQKVLMSPKAFLLLLQPM